jgi:hypothetical protein
VRSLLIVFYKILTVNSISLHNLKQSVTVNKSVCCEVGTIFIHIIYIYKVRGGRAMTQTFVLSPKKHTFHSSSIHLRSVLDKVVVTQGSLRVSRFSLGSVVLSTLHIHLYFRSDFQQKETCANLENRRRIVLLFKETGSIVRKKKYFYFCHG